MSQDNELDNENRAALPGALPALIAGHLAGVLLALSMTLLDHSVLGEIVTRLGVAMALLAAFMLPYSMLATDPLSKWIARNLGLACGSASCTVLLITLLLL